MIFDANHQDADNFNLDSIVVELRQARMAWRASQQRQRESGGREFPSREALADIVKELRGALFPMRLGPTELRLEHEDAYVSGTLDTALHALRTQVHLERRDLNRDSAHKLVCEFAASLPRIRVLLDSDVLAAFHGDPAAHSVDEVLLCYPGIEAMIHHRIAHRLYALQVPLIARTIAEIAHGQTGIDIHPGAQIGAGFFIDHGTGVVIGETAIIGERVRIYQAVTLGAKSFPADDQGHLHKGQPRHPIVEDDVVIYAGATILGRVTIGHGSVIGGNVWLTRSIPPGSNITQASSLNMANAPQT